MTSAKRPRSAQQDVNGKPGKKQKSPQNGYRNKAVGSAASPLRGSSKKPPALSSLGSTSARRLKAAADSSPEKPSNGHASNTITSRPPKLGKKPASKEAEPVQKVAKSQEAAESVIVVCTETTVLSPAVVKSATSSNKFWNCTITVWLAILLIMTNVITLGLWLETKLDKEIQEQMAPQQLELYPKLVATLRTMQEERALMQYELERMPGIELALANWQVFGRDMEQERNALEKQRNECADQLIGMNRDMKIDCVDEQESCPVWAAEGECDTNPGFMLTYCRAACDAC